MVWKVLAKDYGDPAPHGIAYCWASVNDLDEFVGESERDWVFALRERYWRWCCNPESFFALGRKVLKNLEEDEALLGRIVRESKRSTNELRAFSFELRDADLSAKTNAELAAAYDKLEFLWRKMNAPGHVVNAADFEHFELSKKIMAFLEKRIAESKARTNTPEAFAVLTTPLEKNPLALQDEVFYEILAKIQGDAEARKLFETQPAKKLCEAIEAFPEIDRAVHEHTREYDWMQYHYSGPIILDESYFIEALASEARQGVSGKAKLREFSEKTRSLREKQEALARELGLSEKEIYWTRVASSFMFLKAARKDAVFQASRNTDSLVREMARRLALTPAQTRYLTLEEATAALRGTIRIDSALVNARIKHSVWFFERGKARVFAGAEAVAFEKQIFEDVAPIEGVRELKGLPASPGKARGVVRIIEQASDIPKMKQGDVLVSPATNPNLVPAMKKAAAIVTNEGGVTCHAAIVSRELGIPCVIGTRIATKVLKDGDEVEVDANKGIVRKI